LILGAKTHVGKVRKTNEDCYYTGESLWIVADGMGGYKGGDLASSIAVEESVKYISLYMEDNKDKLTKLIAETIEYANRKIIDASLENSQCKGMGTTLTMALYHDNGMYIGHVGDTRVYQIRNKSIKILTEDHSLVGELLKNGQISEKEAMNHPQKNIITRALGTDHFVDPDIIEIEVQKDDLYILASDGLTNLVDSQEIFNIALDNKPQIICDKLIDLAIDRGGYDNITIISVLFDQIPQEGGNNL
jgi:protein phosphatase